MRQYQRLLLFMFNATFSMQQQMLNNNNNNNDIKNDIISIFSFALGYFLWFFFPFIFFNRFPLVCYYFSILYVNVYHDFLFLCCLHIFTRNICMYIGKTLPCTRQLKTILEVGSRYFKLIPSYIKLLWIKRLSKFN